MNFEGIYNPENKYGFLENASFKNFARGFEVYQELLKTSNDKDIILKRMRDLYKLNPKADQTNPKTKDVIELITYALEQSETGKFSREEFADKISSLSISQDFKKQWNPKEGDIVSNLEMISSQIAIREENEVDIDIISIHIPPANVEAKYLTREIKNGLARLADQLSKGKLKCDKLVMKSWLLNKEKQKAAERFLGSDIEISDTDKDDPDYSSSQFLALQYNPNNLKHFLESGEKPEVGEVSFEREEFVEKFGH